jgi:hypothetical protein
MGKASCRPRLGASAILSAAAYALLAVLSSSPSSAQSSVDGAIGGRVTDLRGDSIVAARVSIISGGTGLEHLLATSTDGRLLLMHAAIGAYRITISAPGFIPRSSQLAVHQHREGHASHAPTSVYRRFVFTISIWIPIIPLSGNNI